MLEGEDRHKRNVMDLQNKMPADFGSDVQLQDGLEWALTGEVMVIQKFDPLEEISIGFYVI